MFFTQGGDSRGLSTFSHQSRRSSCPRIALLKFQGGAPSNDLEFDAREFIKDTGFSVFSDPHFLYLMGKFCAKSGSHLDIGLQALSDYMLIMNYYRDYMSAEDFAQVKTRGYH